MTKQRSRGQQLAVTCVGLVAFASLSHYCNATHAQVFGTLLALTPMTMLLLTMVWRATPPLLAALLSTALIAALYGIWPFMKLNFPLLSLLQETGLYLVLGLTFSRSLNPGNIALCTRLADRLHGPLTLHELRYTRQVTLVWAVFFFTVAATSILLFVTAPLRIWSIYINFCVLPMIAALFIAEYVVRQRRLPHVTGTSLLDTVRIYFTSLQ